MGGADCSASTRANASILIGRSSIRFLEVRARKSWPASTVVWPLDFRIVMSHGCVVPAPNSARVYEIQHGRAIILTGGRRGKGGRHGGHRSAVPGGRAAVP